MTNYEYNEKQKQIYRDFLLETFLPLLESDSTKVLEYEQGWYNSANPINAFTKREYENINSLILYLTMQKLNSEDPRFCTFEQAKKNNCYVKKGEHAAAKIMTKVFPYYDLEKDPEQKKILFTTYNHLRSMIAKNGKKLYTFFDEGFKSDHPRANPSVKILYLYHASQIEGLEKYIPQENNKTEIELHSFVDFAAKGMGIEIFHDGRNSAFYRPEDDTIHLPKEKQFKTENEYNVTVLHEITHATGVQKRLNRESLAKYSESLQFRAKEELVAELGAVLVRKAANIKTDTVIDLNNHLAYLQSWKSVLTDPNDKGKTIEECFNNASKASKYICDKEREYEKLVVSEINKTQIKEKEQEGR